mgnify:CR=1 FL=1
MLHHLTFRIKLCTGIRTIGLTESSIELEEVFASVFVLSWSLLQLILLNCVLILLFHLVAHQIDSLGRGILLVLFRVILNKLHVLCAFLYIVINGFTVVVYLFSMILLWWERSLTKLVTITSIWHIFCKEAQASWLRKGFVIYLFGQIIIYILSSTLRPLLVPLQPYVLFFNFIEYSEFLIGCVTGTLLRQLAIALSILIRLILFSIR